VEEKRKSGCEKSWENIKAAASIRARILLEKIMTSDT
jgi:hypothetical protein